MLEGNTLTLEKEEIQIVDHHMVETTQATTFHVPGAKTMVAMDFIYSRCHHYMSDVGRADTSMKAIERAGNVDSITHVIPGHGPDGGQELFDESIQSLRTLSRSEGFGSLRLPRP